MQFKYHFKMQQNNQQQKTNKQIDPDSLFGVIQVSESPETQIVLKSRYSHLI